MWLETTSGFGARRQSVSGGGALASESRMKLAATISQSGGDASLCHRAPNTGHA
jgi:hypothetical protein